MAPDLCPYCGRPAHPKGDGFPCPGRLKSMVPADVPSGFTPQVDHDPGSASQGRGGHSMHDASLGTKLSVGTKVGEYHIVDRIGEGGMGTVYSAVHPIIGKKVAIKVLSARLAKNKNATRRFVLEARAVNDIQHPGLVDIFSFGRLTDGRHYYVMEFLDGRDLGDVLGQRVRLPAREVIPIFLEVGRVLVAVHAKGIVHRDLKPENILLLSDAQPGALKVKLVDFGLAKLIEAVPTWRGESGPQTAAGINVGTPHYMSPEQCRGQKVDGRSDIYALGVLLYECLTGKLPFDGRSPVDIWQAHVELAPKPPIELTPRAVTPALNALILRLLAKKPEDRLQNASEFCAALEGLTEDGLPRGTPVPPPARTSSQDMRHLARALSAPPVPGSLVPLDAATRGAVAAVPPPRQPKPGKYDEMATTTEDLPIVYVPDDELTDEDRRQEIEELRTKFGLRIEEPALESKEKEQLSALAINLGASRSAAADAASRQSVERHSLPLAASSANLRRTSRPIEERTYVPPLAAPSSRLSSMNQSTVETSLSAWSRLGLSIRVALVVSLLVAATVVAIKFIR